MTLPPSGRVSAAWVEKAAQVDAADGDWVLVAEDVPTNVSYRINSGYLAAFRPAGAYQATTRSKPDYKVGRCDVWARRVV